MHLSGRIAIPNLLDPTDSEDDADEKDDFQFGIWLRHRRIDGALNRVPPGFYQVSLNSVFSMLY